MAVLVAAILAQAMVVDRTLALVAGRPIALSDARAALAFGLVDGSRPGAAVDAAVVQRLIDRELMLREAERFRPVEPAAEQIAAGVAAARRHAGGDEGVARVFHETGFSDARLRAWVRDDLLVTAYLQQRFAADERRTELVAEWLAELRRRAAIVTFP